jgi:hypothetical protein
LRIVSLELSSLRVTEDISKDLKILEVEERIVKESLIRKAVPPPMIFLLVLEGGGGRGVLMSVKPGGVASDSSAKVVDGVTQVSVMAKI